MQPDRFVVFLSLFLGGLVLKLGAQWNTFARANSERGKCWICGEDLKRGGVAFNMGAHLQENHKDLLPPFVKEVLVRHQPSERENARDRERESVREKCETES